jgi:FAD:protein FMN transferase
MRRVPQWQSSTHEPVLGTRFELRALAKNRRLFETIESDLLALVERLERVFSVYDESSEISQWRRQPAGTVVSRETNPELVEVLTLAHQWFVTTSGVFHPATATLTQLWRNGEVTGERPEPPVLAALAASIVPLPYNVINNGSAIQHRARCDAISLNAFAKGWIVDQLAERAIALGANAVLINVGGDIRHRTANNQAGNNQAGNNQAGNNEAVNNEAANNQAGHNQARDTRRTGNVSTCLVAIEDPRHTYDNRPPLQRIRVCNVGVATSGSARRGFAINGAWFGHVLDPRNGEPVGHVASATVVAPTAADADALATVLSVLAPQDGAAFIDEYTIHHHHEIAYFIVANHDARTREDLGPHTIHNQRWEQLVVAQDEFTR